MRYVITLVIGACLLLGVASYKSLQINTAQESYIKSDKFVRDRVVGLFNEEEGFFCTGSFVTAPSGKIYVLSAAHCDTKKVVSKYGEAYYAAIIKIDRVNDLLLLEGRNLLALPIAENSFYHEKIRIVGCGHSHLPHTGYGELLEWPSLERDVMTEYPDFKVYQVTSARVVEGDSGAPVVNETGELVGVTGAKDDYGFSYVVPLKTIKEFLADK